MIPEKTVGKLRQGWDSICFLLAPWWKYGKTLMVGSFISSVLFVPAAGYFSATLAQAVIEMIEAGKPFEAAFLTGLTYLLLALALNLLHAVYEDFYLRWKKQEIEGTIERSIYEKALTVDYRHFDDPSYFDSYKLATEKFASQSSETLQNLFSLLNGALIASQGVALLLIVLGCSAFVAYAQIYWSRVSVERETAMVNDQRKADYLRRLFFDHTAVADLRASNIKKPLFSLFDGSVKSRAAIYRKYGAKEFLTDILANLAQLGTTFAVPVYVAWGVMSGNIGGIGVYATLIASSLALKEALNALVAQLGGAHAKEASAALAAFNGKPNAAFVAALDGTPATQANALKLVAKRRITSAADKVFALLNSPDREVRTAAYGALAGVTTPADFNRLCGLLNQAQEDDVKALQAGLKNALAKESPDMQYKMVAGQMAAAPEKARYYPLLAQAASKEAIDALLAADDRQAAFAALLTVENPAMTDVLYDLARQNPAWTDAAISRYTDFVSKSRNTPMRKYQLYRRGLEAKPSPKVQNKLLKALSKTPVFPALTLAVNYMDAPATAETAAMVVKTVAAKNPALGGETVAAALKKAQEVYAGLAKSDADAGYAVDEIKGLLAKLPAEGYLPVSLEPSGWEAVVGDPETRKAMKAKALAKAQTEARAAMAKNWTAENGVLTGAADGGTIGSAKNYENFELILDWKTEGEAAMGIRSIPQIALGGKNSGALTGNMLHDNAAPKAAANGPQEWNTMQVKVVSDRVTVVLNGVTTAENVILENACNREIPAYAEGQILLIAGNAPLNVREMYIRELPATPRFELSEEEAADGFEVLFDGTSMHKWTGNTTNYVPVDGTIYVTAQYGGSGNLYTKKEYGDFVLRFEFAFDREGVNNGIGIRTPMGVDAAYHGMEIQVLDHDAPIYKNLRVYQQHGSVYGIIPAKRVKFPPLGTWNVEEIRAVGDRITVTVNGEVILDGDIRQACQGHNVAPDGGKNNPYTVDHKNHPGLFNASGHIGLLGHGAGIKFRNIRIKELPAAKTKK